MIDRTAALLAGVDAPRAVPGPARMRLAQALEVEALAPVPENLRPILDRAKRMPEGMQARIEGALLAPEPVPAAITIGHRRRLASRAWQMTGAAAAAVLVLVGSVVLTRSTGPSTGGDRQSQPEPIVDVESTRIEAPRGSSPVPGVRPSQEPRVLGDKVVRTPRSRGGSAPIAAGPAVGEGGAQDGGAPGLPERRDAPDNGLLSPRSRSSRALLGIDPVTSLIAQILRILEGDGLGGDTTAGISKPQPAPAKPAPHSATPTRRRARTAAAPRPAPAAPKQAPAQPATLDGIVREIVDVSILSTDSAPVLTIGL